MLIRTNKKNLSFNILIFFFFFATAFPQNQFMELKWKSVGFNYAPGKADIISEDIDNDGYQEMVLDFNNGQYFTVMKYIDNDYQFSWTSPLYQDDNIKSIKVSDINGDSNSEICILHSSGKIDVFDAKTMIKDTTFNTSINNSVTLNIDDIDKDGTAEFIIGQINSSNYASVYVLNSQTLEQEWSLSNISIDSWDIETGDVDNDSIDEIVMSNGLVIDGVSHKADWNYVQGFGTKIALGDIDGDNVKEIISFSNYYDINAFDAQNKTQLWSIKSGEDLSASYVTDIDEDGYAEIIVGNNQWGSINCYSSITKNKIWSVANPNTGTINIALGDPDNDGKKEVIWTSGEGSSGPDFLYVGNIEQGNLEWQSPNLSGPFCIDIHDVNKDGFKDICGTNFSSDNNYSPGRVFIYNPINYKPDWIIGTEGYDYWSFNAIRAGNINDTEMEEIIASSGGRLYIFEAESHKLIWSGQVTSNYSIIKSLEISDIDNDGDVEILVGDENGYLYILNGKTFQEEWHSDQLNGSINKIIVTNFDNDDAKEIAVLCYMKSITVFDGITHSIEWQSNTISKLSTFDIGDIEKNGSKKFIIGTTDGQILIVDTLSKDITDTLGSIGETISGLKVKNIDMDPSDEIIVGASKLYVFNASDMSKKYESEFLGNSTGFGNNLIVTDVENDNHMDIFASNNTGIYQFRCTETYPDLIPPYIVSSYPKNNTSNVTTNILIKLNFSEEINEATITNNNIKVLANDTLLIPAAIKYTPETRTIEIAADTLLPGSSLIKVYCSGNISDQSLNGLDGNGNGVSEGSPKDDFALSFTTGTDRDTVAPAFTDIKLNKNELWPGFDIKITGRVTDSSNVSISQIVSAECFIDSITSAGTGQPFIPQDGLFNSPNEEVSITVKTDNWPAGVHNLYLAVKDFEENTGVMTVTINILSHDKLAANWPMYGQNPQHTFFNINDSIKLPLTIKWSKKLFNNPVNQVAVADNMVFATENNNQTPSKIISLNVKTGDTMWVYDMWGNSYVKTPAYYKGRVYVPVILTPDYGYIYVLDAANGEYLWAISWSYGVGPLLTISDDKIFFKYEFGNFYAVSALERKFLWNSNIYSSKLDWVPSFKDGIVYTCGENSSYCAFDADSGKVISSLGSPMIGITPVVKDNVIYTSSPVSAISLNNNKVLWSKPGTMPSAAYGKIFLVNGDSLQVLDELNGNVLWKFKSSTVITRPPVISNNYVFLSTTNRTLGIDINTHNEVWTYPETGEFVVANNHLFLSTSDGHLICFDEAPVSVKEEERALPLGFDLMQNFPNPFNPSTTIEYALPKKSHVKIEIYNQLGELVRILVNSEKSVGYHTITWNAANISSGVYFCRIITEGYSKTRKMMLLK